MAFEQLVDDAGALRVEGAFISCRRLDLRRIKYDPTVAAFVLDRVLVDDAVIALLGSRRSISVFSALLSNSSISALGLSVMFSSRLRWPGRRGNQPTRRHRNSRLSDNPPGLMAVPSENHIRA